MEDRKSNEFSELNSDKGLVLSNPERLGVDRSHIFGELNTILERQLSVLDDISAYKNEIWTRVQRVSIDAPEQVEVHTIRGDIQQALVNLLDEELFDDEGPEPFFDADAFKEPAVNTQREQYELDSTEMKKFEKMVLDIRQDALDLAAELEKEEDVS